VQNPRVIRRLAGVLLIACALFVVGGGSAAAEVPAGPRLTFLVGGREKLALVSSDPTGGDRRLIAGGGKNAPISLNPLGIPSWSGDGSRVAFVADWKGGTGIDVASADGSEVVEVPGTRNATYPVFSPDGQLLAFARERWETRKSPDGHGRERRFLGTSVWLANLAGGKPRQLTPWRNHLNETPSSFSPDASTLAISKEEGKKGRRRSAVAPNLSTGGTVLLAANAAEPVYSPDGTRLALITMGKTKTYEWRHAPYTVPSTDLAVANPDGSGLTKLTSARTLELLPSWDPSGTRIAYNQFDQRALQLFNGGDAIMEINADGTCRTRVLSIPNVALLGAAWQPGPGREAGPIAC
jgi:Tol biopolymer transport system component